MTTKLTLSVDSSVIEGAKVWAKARKKSVSALVEDYLQQLTRTRSAIEVPSVWAARLHGACKSSVPLPDDTESLVADLISERHR